MKIAHIPAEKFKDFIQVIPNFVKCFAYNLQSCQYKRMILTESMTNDIVYNTFNKKSKIARDN